MTHHHFPRETPHEEKLFSAIAGNPPYQRSSTASESVQNVFHESQELALLISDYSSLIYPAGRWIMRSGKGMREFGDEFLNSPRLRSVRYFNARETLELFPGTLVRDGVGIVLTIPEDLGDSKAFELNGERINRPGSELISVDARITRIVQSLREHYPRSIRESVLPRSYFGIESSFAELNPAKLVPVCEAICAPEHMSDPVKLFTNDKSGPTGRTRWFWVERAEIPRGHGEINRWKVLTRSGIQGHESKLEFLISAPGTAIARSYVVVRSFTSESEAQGFMSYLQTEFAKRLLRESIVGRLSALGVFLPDLSHAVNPSTGLIGWESSWSDNDLRELFFNILTDSDWEYLVSDS